MTIGFSREREAARRRQPGLRQRRQTGGLRPDLFRIGRGRICQRQDEGGHASLVLSSATFSVRFLFPSLREEDWGEGQLKTAETPPSPGSLRPPPSPRKRGEEGSERRALFHVIAVARQRIDDRDLLDGEVRDDLD